MQLTPEQQRVVEQNQGLVGKVLKDKVHGLGQDGSFTYDDLFQIGCIGLCKAAATDKGGCFSTYAYRLIWNEICDALIKSTRIQQREEILPPADLKIAFGSHGNWDLLDACETQLLLAQAKQRANELQKKGIRCLEMSAEGYTSKEIGELFDAQPATIRMWMTKARRFLQEQPEFQQSQKEDTA